MEGGEKPHVPASTPDASPTRPEFSGPTSTGVPESSTPVDRRPPVKPIIFQDPGGEATTVPKTGNPDKRTPRTLDTQPVSTTPPERTTRPHTPTRPRQVFPSGGTPGGTFVPPTPERTSTRPPERGPHRPTRPNGTPRTDRRPTVREPENRGFDVGVRGETHQEPLTHTPVIPTGGNTERNSAADTSKGETKKSVTPGDIKTWRDRARSDAIAATPAGTPMPDTAGNAGKEHRRPGAGKATSEPVVEGDPIGYKGLRDTQRVIRGKDRITIRRPKIDPPPGHVSPK